MRSTDPSASFCSARLSEWSQTRWCTEMEMLQTAEIAAAVSPISIIIVIAVCSKCGKAGRRPAATLLQLAARPRSTQRDIEHAQNPWH